MAGNFLSGRVESDPTESDRVEGDRTESSPEISHQPAPLQLRALLPRPHRRAPHADRAACLVLLSDTLGDQVFGLKPLVTRIGRKPESDIPIADRRVSARHAEVHFDSGSWVLVDLGSTNGTRVNGEAIERVVLERDDRIEIGGAVTLFFADHMLVSPGATPLPRPHRQKQTETPRSGAVPPPGQGSTAVSAPQPAERAVAAARRAVEASAPHAATDGLDAGSVQALVRLGDRLSAANTEEEAASLLLEAALALTGADRAGLSPVSNGLGEAYALTCDLAATSRGALPGMQSDVVVEAAVERRAIATSVASLAAGEGAAPEPVAPPFAPGTARPKSSPGTVRLPRGAAAAPLLVRGDAVGVLYVDREKPGRFFQPGEVLALEAVAVVAAQALDRVRRMRAHEAQAAWRAASVERLSEDRAMLLSMAAHDLKTPLTGLLGYLEHLVVPRLRSSEVPAWLVKDLEVVVDASRSMVSLLTDLLDGQQAEQGELRLDLQPTCLESLLRELGAVYERWAQGAGRRVEIEVPVKLPLVRLDARRVTQIMNNLVHNAIKHTPRGGRVLVAAHPAAIRDGSDRIEIEVTDDGAGFHPSETDRMLALFARGTGTQAPLGPGHGLGLAIVSRLVSHHGGTLMIDGRLGEGARFAFSLPVDGPQRPLSDER